MRVIGFRVADVEREGTVKQSHQLGEIMVIMWRRLQSKIEFAGLNS
jgi:hypothetical protein